MSVRGFERLQPSPRVKQGMNEIHDTTVRGCISQILHIILVSYNSAYGKYSNELYLRPFADSIHKWSVYMVYWCNVPSRV